MKRFFEKKWARVAAAAVVAVAVMYAMVITDVCLRARHAYLEGEKYARWADNPALKQQALDAELARDTAALDARLARGKITKEERDRRADLAKFAHDRRLEESSIKYAYVWYQTAVELFSPPESKWVKLSRRKMPLAKERWKAELRAKHIPFEDYMLD